MQGCQYFYGGVSLVEYCKKNGINISTVHSRIWKKKNNEKYNGLSEQEIVDMVIAEYGNGTKYTYKGITLRQYCLQNNLNYGTITSRIESLREQKPNLSNDDLVKKSIEEFENSNFRFFYQGKPLKEYCELRDINYNSIREFINREIDGNPKCTIEEAIEKYLSKEHIGRYKYYYCGIPLMVYCEENGLSYKNIIMYIGRNRDKFQSQTDDEFIELVMASYEPFELKYVYDGVSLSQYCKKNNLSYYSVVSFVKRRLAKDESLKIDDLIDEGIKTIKRYGIIYYYKGVPLIDYCKEHDLNANSIRCAVLRKKAKDNRPIQEIVDECVKAYHRLTIKYTYGGEPLFAYCRRVGISYNTVIRAYLLNYSSNQDVSIEEAIQNIVDFYKTNPRTKTKYYFQDQSLWKLCEENGYSYCVLQKRIKFLEEQDKFGDIDAIVRKVVVEYDPSIHGNVKYWLDGRPLVDICREKGYSYRAIVNRIKTLEIKGDIESVEERVKTAVQKYEEKIEIKKINQVFTRLSEDNLSLEEIQKICEFLKINYENVQALIEMDFTYNQAINIIWYFYDREDNQNLKSITDNKLEQLFSLIEQVKTAKKSELERFNLCDLIGIFKCQLYDTRNEILYKQRRYIRKTIKTLCSAYGIKLNRDNYEDFESELKLYIILIIKRSCLNIKGQIIRYMDITVKGCFREYLKNYAAQETPISLNEPKYSHDNDSKEGKEKIDYLSDPVDPYKNIDGGEFSELLMEGLSRLPKEDLSLIMLKYQEDYSDEELAHYFHISVEEIREREIAILNTLRTNEAIKSLKN